MGRACLVTGKSGPLLVEVVLQGAARGRELLVTRSGHMDLGDVDEDTTSVISWNRRSALSARSVVLHATNVFGTVDEAIVIFAPTEESATFHESSIVSIEDRIDAEVKGYVYILREVLAQMMKQGSGRLALMMHHPPEDLLTPLEATAVGSFASLTNSLAHYYQNEPIMIDRLRSHSDDVAGYAAFALDRLDALADAESGRGGPRPRRRLQRRPAHYPRRPRLFPR